VVWYQQPRWQRRLVVESALMSERFPTFVLTRSSAGLLVWRGVIRPIDDVSFAITATTPARYPYEAPELRVEQPPLRLGAPHLYASGALCIHKQNWDPMRGTVASVIPLASAWLVGYLAWLRTGEIF
jgi:ubiquitin-protein ligase